MRHRFLLIVVAGLTLLAGCGYRVADTGGRLPQGVERVHVATVVNRTLEPFVEDVLTNALVQELGRRRAVQVVATAEGADAVLKGRITGYGNGIIAYDANDNAAEYRVTILMEAELRRVSDGKLLWEGALSQQEEYRASGDKLIQEDAESFTQETVCRRLAEDVYFRLAEDF